MDGTMVELDDTRRRLLEAAGPLFAEKGFKATNVRDLCERAGAFPGAVNYHFRNKEQLYVETVKHAYECMAAAVPLPNWPPGVPAEQRLRDFIRVFFTRLTSQNFPAWCGRLLMREMDEPAGEACFQIVEGFIKPMCEVLLGILRELVPPGVSNVKLHQIGFSVVGQCLHYHHGRHVLPLLFGEEEVSSFTVDRMAEHVADFSLAALGRLDAGGKVP
jgi:TetR/AcrR family transcriptional regulator, regulator of cefoperazone and chloramphenicol sensitivity